MDRLLKIKEAAPLMAMSPAGLYDAIRKNLVPVVRIGGRIRVSESTIEGWIARGGTAKESEHKKAQSPQVYQARG